MVFIIPLVVVLGVAGVQAGRLTPANLTPTEKQQLEFDQRVGITSSCVMAAYQWRVYHRLSGLDNCQIVLLPLSGEGWPAAAGRGWRASRSAPAGCTLLPSHQCAFLHKPSA